MMQAAMPREKKPAPVPGALAPPAPAPKAIAAERELARLTQREAAAVIYRSWRTWQDWELGRASMDPALWELWLIKTSHLRGVQPR